MNHGYHRQWRTTHVGLVTSLQGKEAVPEDLLASFREGQAERRMIEERDTCMQIRREWYIPFYVCAPIYLECRQSAFFGKCHLIDAPVYIDEIADVAHHVEQIRRVVDGWRAGRIEQVGVVLGQDGVIGQGLHQHRVLLRVATDTDLDGASACNDICQKIEEWDKDVRAMNRIEIARILRSD